MSERVGEACDAWRDDTPPWKGRGRRAWLAGWLAGWSGMMMVVGETKRVDVEYTEVARLHRGYTEGGRERERESATYWGKLSSRSLGFYALRFSHGGEKKKERARRQGGCQAERPIKKSYGLLEPVRGVGSYLLAPNIGGRG